jgi:N-acetyl-alpha-D-glucosaminyl L-malate synthase BshA
MRIGIMCLSGYGGSMVIATQLAGQLARRGHRVHVFARTTPLGFCNYGDRVELHVVNQELEADIHPARLYTDWSADDFEAFTSKILAVTASEGLDVLHFHYGVPFAYIAAEVKRRLEWAAPLLVGTLHGTDVSEYGRDPIKGSQLAQALNKIDGLTTVSDSHARLAADVFRLPALPDVIPDFVDLTRFQPSPAHRLLRSGVVGAKHPHPTDTQGLRKGLRIRIAHLSNFRPVKDPLSMARIFLGIRARMEAELWLIGDGPEMEPVRSLLRHSGFERDVRYWGLRTDVAELLAQTDLLLMTSRSESFCLAALEAMACGVPVLATDVGGLSEVVVSGKTGYLFPVGDEAAAVHLAVSLLSDRFRHQTMSREAALHAAFFGDDCIVPMYEQLYQNLLLGRSNRYPLVPAYHEASLC